MGQLSADVVIRTALQALMLAIGRVSAPVTVMSTRGLSHHPPPWAALLGGAEGSAHHKRLGDGNLRTDQDKTDPVAGPGSG